MMNIEQLNKAVSDLGDELVKQRADIERRRDEIAHLAVKVPRMVREIGALRSRRRRDGKLWLAQFMIDVLIAVALLILAARG